MNIHVFGEGKEEFTATQEERLQEFGRIIHSTARLNGYSNWEMMATCGTMYINYLRNSDKRELAIRDAQAFVDALKYERPAGNQNG